jgi:glycosyltransferase involved in cell wall biosynthesis
MTAGSLRILHIIPAFQHPAVRGPHRHYHFLRELSRRHEVTLVTLQRAEIPPAALEEVASYTKQLVVIDAGGEQGRARPAWLLPRLGQRLRQRLALRDALGRMKQVVAELVAEQAFDVVLFHGKPVYSAIADLPQLPLAVDFCDATSMRILASAEHAGLFRRSWLLHRYRQMLRTERTVVGRTPHLAFISARDREAILGPQATALVLPNGVDLSYWTRHARCPEPHTLIFTGVMDYAPNEDAALFLIEQLAPRVRRALPDLQVLIVGRSPTAQLRARAANQPGVTVTGFVDDLRPYLERATAFVAPLRFGAGMQNKVLEALAMELPVVSTPLAADGLRIDGQESPLVVAAEPDALAAQIIALLGDPRRAAQLAAAGRGFVERHFDWARSAEKLERLCYSAARKSPSPPRLPAAQPA